MQGDLAYIYPITKKFIDRNNNFLTVFNVILVISISYGVFLLKGRGYLVILETKKK